MDIQEDEDLHPPTYNAGRYEQAESMHHIYVQSIKQDPPSSLSLQNEAKKRKKLIHRGGKCSFLCRVQTSEVEFRRNIGSLVIFFC